MITIRYRVTSGYLPITVTLVETGAQNIHNIVPEEGSFTDLYYGTYTLHFVDSQGCENYAHLEPTGTTTTTLAPTTTILP